MTPDLHATILEAMRCATPQTPAGRDNILAALRETRPALTELELDAALETLQLMREINTATITRRGDTQAVYWPTGVSFLAGSFNSRTYHATPKPKEPPMSDSKTARIIKAIEDHGPLFAHELSDASGVPRGNLDNHLKPSLTSGAIVKDSAYCPERGKDMARYMTKEQAELIAKPEPTKPMSEAEANKLADELTSEIVDELEHDRATLLNLIGADSVEQAAEILTKAKQIEHNLANDAAAYKMLVDNICRLLRTDVEHAPDVIRNLIAASTSPAAETGKAALILVDDSKTIVSIKHLGEAYEPDQARAEALDAVEEGDADHAYLVHIVGEARRTVEWRTAA